MIIHNIDFRRMATHLHALRKVTALNKSLIPIKPEGNRIPLYIACGSGLSVFPFYKFAELLHAEQPVYGLEPGAGDNLDNGPINVEIIAAKYVTEILNQNPSGPYALAGHCIGGIIAFEMARQMKELGKEIKLLAMFDSSVQHVTSGVVVNKFVSNLYSKILFNVYFFRHDFPLAIQYKIRSAKRLINKIKKICRLKREDTRLKYFNQLSSNYISGCKNYHITPYDGDIELFYPKTRNHSLSDFKKGYYNNNFKNAKFKNGLIRDCFTNDYKNLGWKSFARSVTVYEIDGDRATYLTDHITQFATAVQASLDYCDNRNSIR